MRNIDIECIERTSAELTLLAEQAGMGLVAWEEFTQALATVVSGSMSILIQNDNLSPARGIAAHAGFSPDHVRKYVEHYVHVNPWNAFWSSVKVGQVVRSSNVMPAASFRGTEFYNDWLRPLGGLYDGIGVKLQASADTPIVLSMQLPDKNLDAAESIIEPIIERLQGVLVRSIATSYRNIEGYRKVAAAAALVNREPDIAFAVDDKMRIVEANTLGEHALSAGTVVNSRNRTLRINCEPAHRWLEQAVMAMANLKPLPDHRHAFSHHGRNYRVSVLRVPEADSRWSSNFILPRYLGLVQIRNLSSNHATFDTKAFCRLFHITPAELRLCELLLENLTLSECADRLFITRETARHRLKQVFNKTGISRQAELIGLLLRFS
ncbi:DNA-binding CsgD family transcriptional regulator/PAS domain-containing protein [Rhizobium aquaticum]|uniref:DNA-binding CsgD family transcriptional regulator/PAS domain-containing protein n=1 Tax=Rhizobium aquaticum TaxID=1549636 RepID=A0ABV2IU62_9HYPH